MPHVIAERRTEKDATITSNIPFVDLHTVPEKRLISIGKRENLKYSWPTDGAELVFVPPDVGNHGRWSSVRIKISERKSLSRSEDIPGPCAYNPSDPLLEMAPAFTVPRAKSKTFPDGDVSDIPGPGTYSIEKPLHTYTRWTHKLVPKSNRWHPPVDPNDRMWHVKRETVMISADSS
jgi:hypothetical protein